MSRSRQQYSNVAARAYGLKKSGAVLALQRPACLGGWISADVSTLIGAGQQKKVKQCWLPLLLHGEEPGEEIIEASEFSQRGRR
jgi:hypothetical protein